MFIFSKINKGGDHCKETSNSKVAKVWPENRLKWLVFYSLLAKSSKWKWGPGFPESTAWDDNSQCPDSLLGNGIPGSRKAGCRRWSREESKACTEMHYQVAQSSGQPVFYFAGTSDEPHEICLRTVYTRGKTRKNFPLTPLYYLLRVPLYLSGLVLYLCSPRHPTLQRRRSPWQKSRHARTGPSKVAIRLTLH